jgi:hypothetical protein
MSMKRPERPIRVVVTQPPDPSLLVSALARLLAVDDAERLPEEEDKREVSGG